MAEYNSSFTGQQIDGAIDQVINKKIPADGVKFSDGETFQQKLDQGELTGPAGQNGADGQNGEDGKPGVDGKSAYESAKSAGYTKTETEFNQALAAIDGKISAKKVQFRLETEAWQTYYGTYYYAYSDDLGLTDDDVIIVGPTEGNQTPDMWSDNYDRWVKFGVHAATINAGKIGFSAKTIPDGFLEINVLILKGGTQ